MDITDAGKAARSFGKKLESHLKKTGGMITKTTEAALDNAIATEKERVKRLKLAVDALLHTQKSFARERRVDPQGGGRYAAVAMLVNIERKESELAKARKNLARLEKMKKLAKRSD